MLKRKFERITEFLESKLEYGKHIESKIITPEEAVENLWIYIVNKLVEKDPDGRHAPLHMATSIHDKSTHSIRPQCNLYLALDNIKKDPKYAQIQRSLVDYIVIKQQPSGLFIFHNNGSYPKGEGWTTNWAIYALLKAYEKFGDKRYLSSAIRAAISVRKEIFSPYWGYQHDSEEHYWCPNISIKFAFVFQKLFEITGEERFLEWANDTVSYQTTEGLFSYAEKRKSIYKTLYHANILFFMGMLERSMTKSIDIQESISKGLSYLESLIREDGSVIEPDMPEFYAYIVSVATTSATFNLFSNKDMCKKVLSYLLKMLSPKIPYPYHKMDKKGYWGPHRKQADTILSEVFFWLSHAIK